MKLFLISSNVSSKKWKKWEKEKYFLQEKETIEYSLSVEKYIDFGSNKFSCFRFPDRVCRNSSTVAKFRLTFHDEKKRKKCDLRYIYIYFNQSKEIKTEERKASVTTLLKHDWPLVFHLRRVSSMKDVSYWIGRRNNFYKFSWQKLLFRINCQPEF